MAIYGYHRTSTKEQHLDRGINEITEFCKDNHYKLEKYIQINRQERILADPGTRY